MIDLLKKWLGGSVTWQEEKRLRKQAEQDTFLADAMEGYDQLPMINHSEKLTALQQQIQKKHIKQPTKTLPYLGRSIAASLALLLSVGLFFLVQNRIQQSPTLAEHSFQKTMHATDAETESASYAIESKSTPLAAKEESSSIVVEPIASAKKQVAKTQKSRQLKPYPAPSKPEPKPTEPTKIQETPPTKTVIAEATKKKHLDQQESVLEEVAQVALSNTDEAAIIEAEVTTEEAIEAIEIMSDNQPAAIAEEEFSISKKPSIQNNTVRKARTAPNLEQKIKQQLTQPLGGMEQFHQYIKDNIKYPATTNGLLPLKGSVLLSFSIGSNGKVKDIQILKGLTKPYNQEAIRLLKKGPKWNNEGGEKGVYEVVFE